MQAISVRFSETVRVLSSAAHGLGFDVPVFRSPPHRPDLDRTIRRRSGGESVISVRLTGRPFSAVQADLIEGLLLVNSCAGPAGDSPRRDLWNALAYAGLAEPGPTLVAA